MPSLPHRLLLIVGILALAACGRSPSGESASTVTDGLGRRIELALPVSKAATISPSATEIAFAAGAGDAIIGVTIADNYPPAVRSLPRYNAYPVDLEGIVALGPQLVLASDQVNHPAQVEALERLGIPCYFFASRSLSDIPELVRQAGHLFGTESRAETVADSLLQQLHALAQRTSPIQERPNVLVLAGADPLYAFGTESYVHEMVDVAGGTSTTSSLNTATPILSDEYVLRSLPDVIVGTDSSAFSMESLLKLHPTWDVVPAIQNGRIVIIDPDLIYRPGPRLIEGAYAIARALHPHLFDPTQ